MSILKKTGPIAGLIIIGIANIFIYWNHHLYYRARRYAEPEEKAALLEKSNSYFPWNDLTFYELGKAYFDLGIDNLDEPLSSRSYLEKAVLSLKKSVLINPASPFTHFQLGQALQNLELVSETDTPQPYREFQKAAFLAGENSQIFHEVGRLFLSRWPELSDTERNFALEIMRKTLVQKDKEEISLVLNTWELNVKDYEMLEKSLPEDARVYRQYAQFLGARSLSLEKRHLFLARAEFLDFEEAKSEYQAGEADLSRSRTHGALARFSHVLSLLKDIKFYQGLTPKKAIDNDGYSELRKLSILKIAKCRIEMKQSAKEYVDNLRQYLSLEDGAANLNELSEYLEGRGIITSELGGGRDDPDLLGLQLWLLYKLGKFDEINRLSPLIGRTPILIPRPLQKSYARNLQMAADSYKETGLPVEAETFYKKALQIDPTNLAAWLGLGQIYRSLNESSKSLEVISGIERVLSPKSMDLKGIRLGMDEDFIKPLTLDGKDIILEIHLEKKAEGTDPLLSVFLNDRVVWDGYAQGGMAALSLNTKLGLNVLQITPVNGPVSLRALTYRTTE